MARDATDELEVKPKTELSSDESDEIKALVERLELTKAGEAGGEPLEFTRILAENRQLVLLGDPGSGKTTLVKWLARACALGADVIRERLELDEELTPIVIPAVHFARYCDDSSREEPTPPDFVKAYFNKQIPGLGDELGALMEKGEALLLVDGLDEIARLDARVKVSRAFESYLCEAGAPGREEPRCILTSRIFGYELSRINGISHWRLAPLEEDQIRRFVESWT
ncbi:MAG: NACHT domain-containing protein, partial [Desulfobacterales bacterium]|nr:NACHT domain-containing protein [Desulfobacterales bacterium]